MTRHYPFVRLILFLSLGGLGLHLATAPAGGQNPPAGMAKASGVIKTESNLVLIDVVATDKKGNYIQDLEKKDFHIYEDDAEQTIASFSREADVQPGGPEHPRYMVLFFDDSSMTSSYQIQARQAAGKFVESSASPDRQTAVVVFGGSLKMTQKFTADAERLKFALSSAKNSSGTPNAGGIGGVIGGADAYFPGGLDPGLANLTGRSPLLALRDVAQSLRSLPGRKTLILFSGGVSLTSERLPEVTAAIDALNKANIAVYPVDVQGVGASSPSAVPAYLEPLMVNPESTGEQTFPDRGSAANTGILQVLAKGTGGFEIHNSNDPLPDLQRVAKETNEYYNLGYTPPSQTHDGSYHKIKVKVDRPGVVVRYRPGYFDVKDPDLLKGLPEGKVLEARVASQEAGKIPVSLSAPYFYVDPGVARVNLALSVPGSAIEFEKHNAAFHSEVNVLGIAYRQNGSVAARFSDKVKLNYEKQGVKDLARSSFDYQNTFKIAPGSYTLKVVLSAGGEKFGKYETPLVVEPFSGNDLSLGGPALGERYVPVSKMTANMDAALIEKHTTLVFKDMILVPSPSSRFAQGSQPVVYVEVYDPELKNHEGLRVGVEFKIVDRKSSQQVFASNTILINEYVQPGNLLVPVGLSLPVEKLQAGDYRLEFQGRDSAGNISTVHTADFSIQ